MKSILSLIALGALVCSAAADELTDAAPETVGSLNVTEALNTATASGIDLTVLNVTTDALQFLSTEASAAPATRRRKRANTGSGIDVHSHMVFPWYKALVPFTAGIDTPDWSIPNHLSHAAGLGITKTILGTSSPQANVFMGDKLLTVAMARLLNICAAGITALYPKEFDFFCVVPLPYTAESIEEAKYCLDTLKGVGITTMTNHEGLYLGNTAMDNFWKYVNTRTDKPVIYVHPTPPFLKVNGQFVEANPTLYKTGLVEFYFETARCYMDLSYAGVLTKYPNIRWIAAHVGGAFPAILDRMIKSLGTAAETTLKQIYNTRVFWDSAGPTYPTQVRGLTGYGIPNSQLLLGTDFPYAPAGSYAGAMAGLVNDPDFSQANITNILRNNSVALFGNKLHF